jgi:hypothetical protein
VQGGIVHAGAPAISWDDQAEDGGGKQLRIVTLHVIIPAK